MAIRRIRTIGDDVLRKISKPVEKIDNKILTLIDDMVDTMYEANGVGLAAPQVGILKRIIVVDVGEGLYKLINPEIVFEEGEQVDEEGCLSIPNRSGTVKRPKKVKVKALNERGEEVILDAEDLFARAICHEIDHLNGVLYIDRIESDEVI
ncbi:MULTISPECIES: peptide deformylase [Caloramator]|jgi:peptide deformylase|uniref:Peptide deformylase n=1 Tax=Caloramator australicus RC3 TaxID=857293 RepID=I7J608_9CLOT|nr:MULTISPECIES: peptide deformylase [Caloramator]MDO6354148.1 peptide deformylase [Caloramator sp. CAR-1]WDU84077.1 peptide deformylase [Caloramator sp. Dgby_cultured_2]CCJ34182.1 Peptide deformylase [Caloramator australicus RC3]